MRITDTSHRPVMVKFIIGGFRVMKSALVRAIVLLGSAMPLAEAGSNLAPWAELIAEKRHAIIRLESKVDGREMPPSEGFFISEDGLALCTLHVWMAKAGPSSILTTTRESLPAPRILEVLPTPGLALVKFEHRPKVWIELADRDPAIAATVAVAQYDTDQPAAFGPVLSFRQSPTADFKRNVFRRTGSIGSWIDPAKAIIGLPVIDQNGHAAGISSGLEAAEGQNIPTFFPIGSILASIEVGRKRDEPIPLPLAEDLILWDPIILDRRQYQTMQAFAREDLPAVQQSLKDLKAAYPNSSHLIYIEADLARQQRDSAGLLKAVEALKIRKNLTLCEQVRSLHYLAIAKDLSGAREDAIKTMEECVKLSPAGYPSDKRYLAQLLSQSDRDEEALAAVKQAREASPGNIDVLTELERILGRLGRWDEQAEVTTEIYRLESLFRRPVLGRFLPRPRE
ncbi:MAG: tetratricopeptide repeat protein [Akkermansiaceae bacterium]|nr:tetratricopeptide repeat protein [Akkermansiaceae bacterium]MCF7730964.1 tetratricopeptide repeat protein [Akkermansiaceae bacterium]